MSGTLNLANYCDACQAIPRHGYCKLAGCPKAPSDTPASAAKGEAVDADAKPVGYVHWSVAQGRYQGDATIFFDCMAGLHDRPLYAQPHPSQQAGAEVCVACEGKPTGENNPCAVCGKRAQNRGTGDLHTALSDAIQAEVLRQYPEALSEAEEFVLAIPRRSPERTVYVNLDISALAEAALAALNPSEAKA